jgi:lipopolysaccharide transport system ATP-binding protein
MKTVIDIQNITKEYVVSQDAKKFAGDHFCALKSVSLKVEKGEAVAIIGNNGSGKSTLLKILSQIVKPTSGQVKFTGDVTSILEIGTNVHPDLTGRQNVALHLQLAGIENVATDSIHKEIILFSGIDSFYDQPVKVYSSGMFLRLAFSMAFHLAADILLLDEVISVGDEGFRLKCHDKMKQFIASGKTVLFVSHNRSEILDLSSRCIWMHKGQVRKDGTPSVVMSEYFALHRDNYDSQKTIISTNKNLDNNGKIQMKWDEEAMPGNNVLGIRELSVQPFSDFDRLLNTQPIKITFIIYKKIKNIQIGAFFFLQDVYYQPVLVAHFLNNTSQQNNGILLKDQIGFIEITCLIPANFLLPGKYYLLPRFGVEANEWTVNSEEAFRFEETLQFTLHADSEFVDLIGDPSKGAVRPLLEWTIKKA